jgi:diaminohydroxyphosphoribosylaminopyrimidine deaminase/5-amino-6-(5-phosphoribosylamino)uracil reductase
MDKTMHHYYMQQALAASEQARFIAPPNPWVGCVIVKDQKIVGRGHTQPIGQAHAEVMALNHARELARGATMYVTLEPCPHHGKTSPCTDAIVQAGIQEVYIAQLDPDSKVSGQGIKQLQEAGVKVIVGICEQEAKNSLAPYLHQRHTGLPYTILKSAVSLDGRTACVDLTSQWISSEEARVNVHRVRAESQAIIIGSGTALKDLPKLNVRHPSIVLQNQPLRVLLDRRGRVPAEGPLFDTNMAPTLVMTSKECPAVRRIEWEKTGAEVIEILTDERTDLKAAWKYLGNRGVLQLLVEGGAHLHTSVIQAGLFDRFTIYIGSVLLGCEGLPFFLGKIATLTDAPRMTLLEVKQFGDTIRADYTKAH